VGLAEPDTAEKDDVGLVFEELESEEVLDGHAVDFLGPVPLKLLEGFDDGEPRHSDFALNGAVPTGVDFSAGEVLEVLDVCPVVPGGLIGRSLVMLVHEAKIEGLEMIFEAGLSWFDRNSVLIHGFTPYEG
jgi:hypothetical protein